MSKITERNLVVGLDIGTSKISVAVGEITPDNQLSIVGVGNQPARGMDKGGVNDLNLVIQSIQRAINEAELMVTPSFKISCQAKRSVSTNSSIANSLKSNNLFKLTKFSKAISSLPSGP